jgi:hypothetical protein
MFIGSRTVAHAVLVALLLVGFALAQGGGGSADPGARGAAGGGAGTGTAAVGGAPQERLVVGRLGP